LQRDTPGARRLSLVEGELVDRLLRTHERSYSFDSMTSFVQVAEVWTLEHGVMRLHSGAYGEHEEIGKLSADTGFAFGEGLPGSVWSSGKPQVWDRLEAGEFVRLREAQRAELHAALGIPVRAGGGDVNAVAVLLCGNRTQTGGCIERWDHDPTFDELRYAGGYYGQLEAFARLGPRLRFQAGSGLPGLTLQRGLPTILEDTRLGDSFMRAELARESGIEGGIGIPVYHGGRVKHVLILLSARATPLARAFEVWIPGEGGSLRLEQALYAKGLEDFAASSEKARLRPGEGLAGRALRTELPQVFDLAGGPPLARSAEAAAAGLSSGIAIPVLNGYQVLAVVVLLS